MYKAECCGSEGGNYCCVNADEAQGQRRLKRFSTQVFKGVRIWYGWLITWYEIWVRSWHLKEQTHSLHTIFKEENYDLTSWGFKVHLVILVKPDVLQTPHVNYFQNSSTINDKWISATSTTFREAHSNWTSADRFHLSANARLQMLRMTWSGVLHAKICLERKSSGWI